MPVRMVKDPGYSGDKQKTPRRPGNRKASGGSGGILGALLPMLLKKPKLLLLLVGLGAIYFIFIAPKMGSNADALSQALLGLGAEFDEQVYDEAEVFEPLADNIKNPMPERVSLASYAPQRRNQGRQGSCVGWASAYAARSILHGKQTGRVTAFSPSYVYNQIALEGCQGSYIIRAMEAMQKGGAVPFTRFGYTDESCRQQPDQTLMREASSYKIKGFNRLSKGGNDYKTDMLAIKQNLAQGAPVVIGMMVGGSFMQGMMGNKVWQPTSADYTQRGFGGHAMCVIGYDDYLEGGSFQIMNSWGPEWGENGIGWVRYKDFDFFAKEAYGLYPMGDVDKPKDSWLDAEFALVENNTGKRFDLRMGSGTSAETRSVLSAGTQFKIEITNSNECYVYVFGEETDGSTYVLFPYTPKHSPYCGITGTRMFPRDHSMQLDNIGNRDRILVLLANQALDYNEINSLLNSSAANGLNAKLNDVLGDEMTSSPWSVDRSAMKIRWNMSRDNLAAAIIEIRK